MTSAPARRRERLRAAGLAGVVLVALPRPAASQEVAGPRPAPVIATAALPDAHPAAPLANPWVNHALLVGTLFALDLEARSAVQRWRGEDGDEFWSAAGSLGEWKLVAPLVAGGSLLAGWASGGGDGVERGVAVIAGMAAGSAANETLNQLVGRSRPGWERGVFDFRPFSGHSSFPSGHTGFAFSVAGAIDGATESAAAAAVAYAAAGLVGFSRLNDDKHWLSDVVVASLLSSAVARRVAGGVRRAFQPDGEGEGPAGSGRGLEPGRAGGVETDAGPELRVTPRGLAVRIPL